MRVLAIDPGPEQSAWLLMADGEPVDGRAGAFGIVPNAQLLADLRFDGADAEVVVIEQIASYGMAVGAEIFATVHWAGRFHEAASTANCEVVLLPRLKVKQHLCHDSRAKDANIRQALLDRFGGQSAAMGRKSAPGPLYGVSRDVWSALALAITYSDGAA